MMVRFTSEYFKYFDRVMTVSTHCLVLIKMMNTMLSNFEPRINIQNTAWLPLFLGLFN